MPLRRDGVDLAGIFAWSGMRWIRVLPLGIARKHLDDKIMQTIVELLLKNPRKLAAFDLTWPEQKDIGMYLRVGRRVPDFHLDALRSGAGVEDKQGMLVAGEFGAHFVGERVHGRPAADVPSSSSRAAISAQTFSNALSARASNKMK